MRQQINLVNALPKREQARLSVTRMKQVCLIFIALLVVIYAISLWQRFSLGRDYKQIQAKEQALLTLGCQTP